MSGAILDLQRAALDREYAISDLLRRALVTAKKLGMSEFEEWIRLELNGYPSADEVPSHRVLTGVPMAMNPVRGWVPIGAADAASIAEISRAKVSTSVTELEELLEEEGELVMSWPPALAGQFVRQNPLLTNPVTKVSHGAMGAILQTVRNEILEWALKLEADGIKGDGLEFTEQEKTAVQAKQHVSNYYGPTNISHVTATGDHATIDVSFGASDIAVVVELAESLREIDDRLGLQRDNLDEMRAELTALEAQAASPRPKPNMLKSGLESLVRILGAAAAKEAAGPLMHKAAELLQRFR